MIGLRVVTLLLVTVMAGVSVGAPAGQDLPPEVLLLSRIKNHMRTQVAQLPNSTCLETATRFHKESSGAKLRPLDILRLEVVYSGGREWYGSPGDPRLSEENPAAFIGAGMIGNGVFGITLYNLFVADAALFKFQGKELEEGREVVRYDFRFPRVQDGFQVSIPGGVGAVGEEGTLWADSSTLELLRMTIRVTEIPPYLPLASAQYNVTYAHTRIGEFEALLPQQSDMDMQLSSGVEDYDRFDFTHCRAFGSHSEIRFESDEAGAAVPEGESSGAVAAVVQPSIPALLPVTIALTTTISDRDAVGMPIEGSVAAEVRYKNKIVIKKGALVRGRIRRLDRYPRDGHFVVGLEFTEVQVNGAPVRFFADLLRLEKQTGIQQKLRETVVLRDGAPSPVEVVIPELAGVASFFVEGNSFTLPAGFQTVWRTRGLIRGAP